MEEKIIGLLKKIKSGIDYANESAIFTGHILDSLEFVKFVSSVEEEFSVSIDFDDMEPEKFDSVSIIRQTIEKQI